MQPLLFIDFETTGLNPAIHAPIEIAAVVLAGPHHNAIFHCHMRPFQSAVVVPQALAANGCDPVEIWTRPCPTLTAQAFHAWLVMMFPPPTLVVAAGWKYDFDRGFLREWFTRHLDDTSVYGNTFSPVHVECMNEMKMVFPDWRQRFPNMKLTTQYLYHFQRPLNQAHTAHADILATRELFLLCDALKPVPQYTPYHENASPTSPLP